MAQTGRLNMTAVTTARANVTPAQEARLMKARCRLMTREPWYGHVAMGMVWIPSNMPWSPESSRTMGVRITSNREIQCLYYPKFVESLTVAELFAVIQHEIEHIVRCHCLRVGSRQPEAWNIACDMCVNGTKSSPRIGYPDPGTSEIIIPMKDKLCWIPEDWPKDGTAEEFYDRLEKEQQKRNVKCCGRCGRPIKDDKDGKGGKGKGKGEGEEEGEGQGGSGSGNQDGEGGSTAHQCPSCGQTGDGSYEYGGQHGRALDDHSVWNQTDVGEDEARQVVKDVTDQATEKCQGNAPGHLIEALKELAKPVVRWREVLRTYFGRHVGNRRYTFSRMNRRALNPFGTKGISRHAAATVAVIIDTSGSIGSKELEQFFAEIDMIASRAKVHVLQWDHAFQGYSGYRRGDWKNYQVHGRGGTDMCAPIDWLIQHGAVADVQVMLTDGYCNWHDPCPFPMVTVITTPEGTTDGPGWGHEVRMKIHQ